MTTLRRVNPAPTPGRMPRLLSRVSTTRAARFISRHLGWKLDPVLLRLTGNRVATTVVIPTAVLETRGARSGKRRRNAVIYFHDGDRVILAASNAGADRHPDWYHNVLADSHVTFGGAPMQARVVEDTVEQERLWSLADRVFPGFAVYRRDAGAAGRQIPLISLTAS
jgi:deazaflavin-dependent oxidoreductase (nitroreductase family)